MRHSLKTWPHEFAAIKRGEKTFEVRDETDRDFAAGDVLELNEWDPQSELYGDGMDAVIEADVTYVLHGGRFGLPPGLCVMAIKVRK